ncbi:MAG TPA: septum formation initiator family protein [Kofleriaceae bacterium]|nr:septum formation initiator family protein [Kofleriaceae bacterium]
MPKIVADMHIPPAFRRWGARFGLAVLIAIAIGYLPGQVLRRDPRAAKLEAQIEQLVAEGRAVAARNVVLRREIAALRSEVGAIEDRARADLGLVYPDEIVLRLAPEPVEPAGGERDGSGGPAAEGRP